MFLIYQLILYIQISPGTAPHPRKRSVFWALIVADRVSSKLKAVDSLFYLTIQALINCDISSCCGTWQLQWLIILLVL